MEQQINHIEIKAEDHLGLVRSIACKYVPSGVKLDDTEEYSDGLLGLFNAIKKYDPEREKFSTYATRCIRNEIIDGIRDRNRKKRLNPIALEIDVPQNEKEQINFVALTDHLMADHPDDTSVDIQNKKILYEHIILGKTWQDIGDELGVSKVRAMQRGQIAIQLLKDRFSSIDDIDLV